MLNNEVPHSYGLSLEIRVFQAGVYTESMQMLLSLGQYINPNCFLYQSILFTLNFLRTVYVFGDYLINL